MNIKDIAAICGVSPSTVSKVLNHKDEDLSAETRKKVLAVIKEYQYVPYLAAINNASPNSHMIGVLSCGADNEEEVIYAVEEVLSECGYSLLWCNTKGLREKAGKFIHILETKHVDGIILIGQNKETAECVTIPSVAIWNSIVRTNSEAVADISYDPVQQEYLAVKYLLEHHHRKVGYLICDSNYTECIGYHKVFQEFGVVSDSHCIFRGKTEEEMDEAIFQCMNADITAVLCSSVEIAGKLYERLKQRGDRLPEDMSIIALGRNRLEQMYTPPLTTAGMNSRQLGIQAATMLIDMIEEKKSAHACSSIVPTEINPGKSVLPLEKSRHGNKLVVIGSMNMDCSISVPYIPTDGETLMSDHIMLLPGGKGANQAVGAGRLGSMVYMIGCLGNDSDGKQIYDSLTANHVQMDGVAFVKDEHTGKAYIHVAPDGESTIVVYPGANQSLDAAHIKKCSKLLEGAKYCLLSLEISQNTAEYAIRECGKQKIPVILKPAAVSGLKEELYNKIDYLIPNEKELNQFVPGHMQLEDKAACLLQKGVKNIIVTLGKKGCYLRNSQYSRFFPAVDFSVVDTTGAADAFISAFAVYLSEGNSIIHSIGFAVYAASISITRCGVQQAMTDRAGLEIYRDAIFHTSL